MKTKFFILSTLFLGMLCLGGASTANAQSVHGGGSTANFLGHPPLHFSVSAHIGEAGPQGNMLIGAGRTQFAADVVQLCVFDNRAVVVGVITRSTFPGIPVGAFVAFGIQDNGDSLDGFEPIVLPTLPTGCTDPMFIPPAVDFNGNFTVKPSDSPV